MTDAEKTTGAEELALHDGRAILKHIILKAMREKVANLEKTLENVSHETGIPVTGIKGLVRPFVYKVIDEFFEK